MALLSILCLLLTYSWLPFEDKVSWRSEKRAIARGHQKVFFCNFMTSLSSSKALKKAQMLINGAFAIMEKYRQ